MKNKNILRNPVALTALATSTAFLGVFGALTLSSYAKSPSSTVDSSDCLGVGFLATKGGPGAIEIEVDPILLNRANSVEVFGSIINGNDTGEVVTTNNGVGEITFSWDSKSNDVQTATIALSAIVTGMKRVQTCPETTMYFDPSSYILTPAPVVEQLDRITLPKN